MNKERWKTPGKIKVSHEEGEKGEKKILEDFDWKFARYKFTFPFFLSVSSLYKLVKSCHDTMTQVLGVIMKEQWIRNTV